MEINLTVTIDDFNIIIGVLADKPFKEVHALIHKLSTQAVAQTKKPAPVVNGADPEPPPTVQ